MPQSPFCGLKKIHGWMSMHSLKIIEKINDWSLSRGLKIHFWWLLNNLVFGSLKNFRFKNKDAHFQEFKKSKIEVNKCCFKWKSISRTCNSLLVVTISKKKSIFVGFKKIHSRKPIYPFKNKKINIRSLGWGLKNSLLWGFENNPSLVVLKIPFLKAMMATFKNW